MFLTVVVAALMLLAYVHDGYVGYPVVAVIALIVNVAAGILLSAAPHVLRWGTAVAVIGAAILAVPIVTLARRRQDPRLTLLSPPGADVVTF